MQSFDLRIREREVPDGALLAGAFLSGRSSVHLLSGALPWGGSPRGAFFQGCLSRESQLHLVARGWQRCGAAQGRATAQGSPLELEKWQPLPLPGALMET